MNSFFLAFSVVCPLFLMMALGYGLRKIGMFTEDLLRQLNRLCFQVFLPLIVFVNVYNSDFSTDFKPGLVGFAVAGVVVIFVALLLIVPRFEKDDTRRSVLIQGMFRSNYVLFGLPIAKSLFGEANTGTTAVLIAFIVPLFNVLAVCALEIFRNGTIDLKSVLTGIITNPLILGALAAFFFIATGIRLPIILEQTIGDIANIATPLALIVLGGSFAFSSLKGNGWALASAVGGKLIIVPLIGIVASLALGYRGIELGALMALFASPTAVSSFTMAQQMEADDRLAGQIVVMTSLVSVASIFIWVTILEEAGLLVA
ncbi:MAG: AEC family transporter [Raoultibacter sp.]